MPEGMKLNDLGTGDIESWFSQGGNEGPLQCILNVLNDIVYGLWADERLSLTRAARSLIIGVRRPVC